MEIAELHSRYPSQATDLANAQSSLTSYVVTPLRHYVKIEPYAAPSTRSWHYSVPEDHTVTGGQPTAKKAALALNFAPTLERQNFESDFTSQILTQSPYGTQYVGSSALLAGKGLKESGLDHDHPRVAASAPELAVLRLQVGT
jgi:hypothetical protein